MQRAVLCSAIISLRARLVWPTYTRPQGHSVYKSMDIDFFFSRACLSKLVCISGVRAESTVTTPIKASRGRWHQSGQQKLERYEWTRRSYVMVLMVWDKIFLKEGLLFRTCQVLFYTDTDCKLLKIKLLKKFGVWAFCPIGNVYLCSLLSDRLNQYMCI